MLSDVMVVAAIVIILKIISIKQICTVHSGYFVLSLSSRRWRSAGVCDIIVVLRLNLRGI